MVKTTDNYRRAYSSLNNEQRQAVDHLDGPVLVLAGPGSGKTQLLATRVGRILEQTDATPENILCLTFSDSAATTMQNRLVELIGPPALEVTVSTYHSFGSELLSKFPELFGLQVSARPADELLLDQTLRQVLKELDYSNPLKAEVYVAEIEGLISGYKRALIGPDKLLKICDANERFIKQASALVNEYLPALERLSKSHLTSFAKILKHSYKLDDSKLANITPLKTLWLEDLSQSLAEATSTNKTSALSKFKATWLEKDNHNGFVLKGLRQVERQRALAQIFDLYNQKMAELNLYDYDDMIMLAIGGLNHNLDIKFSLQERYQYILLDEFQDTNEAQFKLVELLTDNPANEARPNILAVGDDDQAIYAFQGAHYSHLSRFIDHYKNVTIIGLKINYRSTPGIINLSGELRSQISDDLKILAKTQNSSSPNTQELIVRYQTTLDIEHLAWTAKYIKKLIRDGTNAKDIAVFAPKHKYLIELVAYLHAQNIAVSYEQQSSILGDPTVHKLLVMSELIVNLTESGPKQDSLWPEVLSYDFWRLPTKLIWQLAWQAKDSQKPWINLLLEHTETKKIALFFIRLSQIASYSSYEQIINYLIGSSSLDLNQSGLKSFLSPFYKHHFQDLTSQSPTINKADWQLLSQLSSLRAHINAASEEALTVKQFLESVSAYKAAELTILDKTMFRESSDSVNLMTAFGSKGQEFPVVVLINLTDEVWGSSARSQSNRISLPANLAHVRQDIASEDERLRLLFVAISRAKNQLVLVSYQENLAGKASKPLKFLQEYQENDQLFSPLLPETMRKVIKPTLDSVKISAAQPAWFDRHLDDFKTERRTVLRERLEKFRLSATKLNNFSDVSRGGPIQFYLDSILNFPSPPTLTAQFGSTIHHVLDWQFKQSLLTKLTPPIDQVLAEFERELKLRRLNAQDFELLLKRGKLSLSSYLKQTKIKNLADDLSEERLEVNLGEARLVGGIDRLIIDQKARTIKIVDFKTGSQYSRFGSSVKAFHHQRQLYFYKLLIELTPKFRGYQVISASVQFVEPDPISKTISSLELKFNNQSETYLKHLITAVWKNIMELKFPPTDSFPRTLKAIMDFERDLLN